MKRKLTITTIKLKPKRKKSIKIKTNQEIQNYTKSGKVKRMFFVCLLAFKCVCVHQAPASTTQV